MCLACSHVVRCSETALVFNLACSVNRVLKFRTVLPMYVAEQPGQENSYTRSFRSKSGILSFLDRK